MKRILVKMVIWLLAPLLKRLATGQESFRELDKYGLHLMQSSFYSPIPDLCKLDPPLFERSLEMPGVDFNVDKQLELLGEFSLNYKHEYSAFPTSAMSGERIYCAGNDSFPAQDGAVLHCMVRHFKPKKIIEIGSGNSSLAISGALALNCEDEPDYVCDWTAIEPYPQDILKEGIEGINGLSRLLEKHVQDVSYEEFEKLGENDILFIDSSHVLKINSDVHYEYLEIFPRLKPGVLIHIHDVFLPMEYPKQWLTDRHWFWNEQYLLQAFLSYNDQFEVLYSGHFLAKKYSEEMKSFSSYTENNLAASFWMRRI